MVIGTQVISYNDNLYQLLRTFHEKADFPVNEAKEYYNCDTVLRKEGRLYFCRLIEEAQVITEDNEQQIQLVETEQKTETSPEKTSTEG
jgi:hypothetical protein